MRWNGSRALVAIATAAALALAGCSAGSGTQPTEQTTTPPGSSGSPGSQSSQPASSAPTSSSGGSQSSSSGGGGSSSASQTSTSSSGSGGSTVANACETPGSDAKPYDGTMNLGLVLEPTSLDFTTQSGAQAPQLLLGNVYQTLVWQNPDGELAPCLAKSWTVSDDGKTYTFEIEPDVTFSDGSPFTADDAAFTINYVKDKWTNGVKKYMDVVDSATAVSPSELKVVLKQPSNLWLYKMASRVGAMMSPKHVDKLATEAIGTGPYTLGTWKHGDSITLNRADKYWGAPAPVKTVVFKYFQDPTAMNNAFLTGGIQVITTVQTPQVLAQFQNNPKYVIIDGTTTGKVMMAINNAKPPLNDLKVRQAINYALDKDALLKGAWAGYGTVIGSHEVPTDPWYVDLNDKYPHDVAKAKQLLADAGQSNLKLTLQLPPVPYAAAAAPIIKSQLAQAGITVDVSNVTWDNWLAHIFGKPYNYDLTIVNHVEAFDVTNVFSGKADYYTQYVNPKITQLEQEGDAGDHATFIKDFQQVVTTLADDAAAVWLWAFPNLMVVDANVHGLPKNAITEGLYVYQLTVS